MARAGKRNRLLYLQKPSRSTAAASGYGSVSYTNVGRVWASVTPFTGLEAAQEKNTKGQVSAMTQYEVETEYRNDIYAGCRFLIDCAAGQLNEALDDSETVITVDDPEFVGEGQARRERVLLVDDESMLISDVSGNDVTVERGAFGTTPAEHDDNSRAILYRQLNISGEPYDPTGRRRELRMPCIEVN